MKKNKMKIVLVLAIAIALCFSLTVISWADETDESGVIAEGTCGDDLNWVLMDDGVLTISGTGDMDDYSSIGPWSLYRSSVTEVIVEEGVTSVGDRAFNGCTELERITLPEGLTTIGVRFLSGTAVESITLPASLTSVHTSLNMNTGRSGPFSSAALKEVIFADGTTEIPTWVLCKSNVETVVIPDTVTSLANYAFWDASSLVEVTLPDSVTSIGTYAFGYCTSLESVTLSGNLTSIPQYAFRSCTSLENISIPAKVKGIDTSAFYRCTSLKSIMLPKSVMQVGVNDAAFRDCSALTDVYFAGSESDAEMIYISDYEDYNEYLINAEWHYDSELAAQDDGSGDIIDENAVYYTINYNARGMADIADSQVLENDFASRPAVDMSRSGYTFLGWYNGDEKWNFFTPVTEDMTLTAKWEDEEVVYTYSNGSMYDADGYTLMLVGNTRVLSASDAAVYDTITDVSWSSIPSGMSLVDSSSTSIIVQATQPGTYSITATVTSSYTYYNAVLKKNVTESATSSAPFNLRAVELISDISLVSSVNMTPGTSTPLEYSTTPSGNYAKSMSGFNWYSSDMDVVTISDDGILTAVGEGTATITVSTVTGSADTSITKTCIVTVREGSAYAYGDVDRNGVIDVTDALLVLRNYVGLSELDEEQKVLADVNGENGLNVEDALLILRHYVNLIDVFPVET